MKKFYNGKKNSVSLKFTNQAARMLTARMIGNFIATFFSKTAIMAVLALVITNKSFADYTIASGTSVNASTITGQSGILIINGTLHVNQGSVSLLGFTSVVIGGPNSQIFWDGNNDLHFSDGISFAINNAALGLQPTAGNGNASTRLYIGTVLIAVSSDNSNNAAFSFQDFNMAGGLPQFTLTSASPVCYTPTFSATITPLNTIINYDCKWSVDNGSISPAAPSNFKTPQTATITPINSSSAKTYTISCTLYRAGDGDPITTKQVTVTVNPVPATPTSVTASPSLICNGSSSNIKATSSGNTIQWYTVSSGGTIAGSAASGGNFSVAPASSVIYYAGALNASGCVSSGRSSVAITVNQKSADPVSATASSTTICNGSSTVLTLNGGGGATGEVIHWYSGSCGGTAVGTGNGLAVSPNVTTTYFGRYEDVSPCNYTSACASITITVNQPATVGISGNATICSGSSAAIIFNATPYTTVTYTVNSGSNQTIQVGAGGTATLNSGPLFTQTTFNLVNIAYTNPPGCSQSAAGSVTINVSSGTWLGITADWNDAENWCGGVPSAITDVTIPSGTPHDPVLSSAIAMVHNITIAAGATVTITGQTLQIGGTISEANAGSIIARNGTVSLNGTSAQTIPPSTFRDDDLNNLIISNTSVTGVTLGGNLNIYESLTYGASGTNLNTGGFLTLKSTKSATAWVGDLTGHTINGDVTVERYIATGTASPDHPKSWQLLAIPTQGQTIHQAWQEGCSPNAACVIGYGTQVTGTGSGFDVTTSGPSMKTYDYASSNYVGISGTGIPIYNQKGYFVFVRGDRTVATAFAAATETVLRTKGKLFTPANTPPVTVVNANSFESAGNPYASPIDMRKIGRTGDVLPNFIVWDSRLGSQNGYGAFQYFFQMNPSDPNSDYVVTPGGGSYGASLSVNNYIQSGQAFFVQTRSGGTSGTLTFSEAAKAGGTSSVLFTTPNPVAQTVSLLNTLLYEVNANGNNSIVDGVVALFGDTYNNAMDARKATNSAENLAIKTAGTLLAVTGRHTITAQDTIFFNLTGTSARAYRFHFDAENLDPSVQCYLVDNYTNSRTPLNMTGTTDADFTIANVTGSNAANRFMIVFEPAKVLPVTFTSIKAWRQDKDIEVQWRVDNERNIKQYEVEKSTDGSNFTSIAQQKPMANNGGSALYVSADANPVTGVNYYRVKSIDIDGKTSYTNVVKVSIGSIKQDISIYPNPITDGMIHLQFLDEPAGKYNIRLLNKLGQVMLQKLVIRADGNSTELIKWDYNLAHGIYELEVKGPNNISSVINVSY